MSPGYRIAVVGATGAVGTVMLQCLKERGLDQGNEIVLFASERSAGRVAQNPIENDGDEQEQRDGLKRPADDVV